MELLDRLPILRAAPTAKFEKAPLPEARGREPVPVTRLTDSRRSGRPWAGRKRGERGTP
jgi:hypothetical protein